MENFNRSKQPRLLIENLLLSCGVIGSILFTTFYFAEAMLSPGYSSMEQAISDLELAKYGWMQSANFILLGIFMCFFGIGLTIELKRGWPAFWLPFLQYLIAFGLILSGLFIHDPYHSIASMISFIPLVAGFFVFAIVFANDDRWTGWMTYSIVSGVQIMVFLTFFGFYKSHGGPAGLFERLVVAVRSIWSLIFTYRLLNGTRLTQKNTQSQ